MTSPSAHELRRRLAPNASGTAPPTAGRRFRGALARLGTRVLTRLLGTADGPAVATVAGRELSLILRSREWHRFLGMWLVACGAILLLPLLYRAEIGGWLVPTGRVWAVLCGYALQIALGLAMAQWTMGRIRRDLSTNRLDELMMTRCSPADIAMGEAIASAVASLWLVAAAAPVCMFLAAMAGEGFGMALRLALSLAPIGALGVWFGMGWGLAFTARRSAVLLPLTHWWIKVPFVPFYVMWAFLIFIPTAWAILELIPGGHGVVMRTVSIVQWLGQHLVWHWNPLLTIWGAGGLRGTTWITDWLVLLFYVTFMMRNSMDAVQIGLRSLPERDRYRTDVDAWIHHDGHFFTQYGDERRIHPVYRDGGNAITAFDVALGHRVFLHPFLWTVGIMLYVCLTVWSLLAPDHGKFTAIAAVLTPATGALLLMSGGVAVSFGWERDQHRWPSLAAIPMSNITLALGKIKGVVRPTLWLVFVASITALVFGWRGALDPEAALWMSLHVLLFPVVLAVVSATLALTTPTLGEALYRWAVLGAIPTLATVLPYPIGGHAGIALPFTPPLLVLLIVVHGPTPDLVRAAWIALGLELAGLVGSLLILGFLLRRWTVGERD